VIRHRIPGNLKPMKIFLPLALALTACASLPTDRNLAAEDSLRWVEHRGVEVARVDGSLVVARADPARTPLVLLNAPESAGSVSKVAAREGFALVTNAAMFAKDYTTSIGYMRNYDRVNNPRVASKLKGYLMFNPREAGLPAVKVGNREESGAYHTTFQSHRMWSLEEGILWKKGASIYRQVALVGVDEKSRVLFFFHPASVDVHDLVARILDLRLGLKGLLYLDGGFHGTFYLSPELGGGWNNWISLPNLLAIRPAP
jgi:hypothetical protein